VAYSSKVQTLLTLKQPDEAERFAKTAMAEAKAGDRRIKEIELSMMLAEIAERRGQPEQAVRYLEQAVGTAKAGQVQRLLAEAEATLADAYRARGDLTQALRYASAAVASTTAAGSRFLLPDRLRGLAEIHAAQGRVAEANRTYDQAADIVEGNGPRLTCAAAFERWCLMANAITLVGAAAAEMPQVKERAKFARSNSTTAPITMNAHTRPLRNHKPNTSARSRPG
jgi:tetratricopeptide (TPR) repeat protein